MSDESAWLEKYWRQIDENIRTHGWFIQGVLGSPEMPQYAYTVGMTETIHHPEMLMIGFDLKLMQKLMNDIGALVREGDRFGDWSTSAKVIKDYPVVFRAIPDKKAAKIAKAARSRYGTDKFSLLQVFLPDENGSFPWDDQCNKDYIKAQGVLIPAMRKSLS